MGAPLRRVAPLALALAVGACSDAAAPSDSTPAVAPARVVLVSVDGLRGDAMAHMPQLAALAATGASTDAMSSVLPALTVPGHLAMFSGRDVTRAGITSNALDTTAAMRFVFSGASTVFHWVHTAGGTSEAIAGASLFGSAMLSDAREIMGLDSLVATDTRADAIADRVLARIGAGRAPDLLFVHFPDADLAGHEHGWVVPGVTTLTGRDSLSPSYLDAARRVDAAIGRVAAALRPAMEAGEVVLVVTADHGGGSGEGCVAGVPSFREHCTAAPGDELIPFVMVGRGIAPRRLPAGMHLTQVGPTVSALLGVPARNAQATAVRL
jgi:predicted AlkP superfamily pyrophosphatase or phosphodiesterase